MIRVISYNGTTHEATVSRDWWEVPDATSAYVMLPTGSIGSNFIASSVWDAQITNYQEAGTTGEALEEASNMEQVNII